MSLLVRSHWIVHVNYSEREPRIQVGESSKPSAVDELKNETVKQVFSNMFKSYLEDQINQKGKEIELKRSKAEKEIVQLKYKRNQKQFELHAHVGFKQKFILQMTAQE